MDIDFSMLGKESAESSQSKPGVSLGEEMHARTLNIVSEDAYGCCAAIKKALREKPDLDKWDCPKCGLIWRPRPIDGMRLWEGHPVIQVWKKR